MIFFKGILALLIFQWIVHLLDHCFNVWFNQVWIKLGSESINWESCGSVDQKLFKVPSEVPAVMSWVRDVIIVWHKWLVWRSTWTLENEKNKLIILNLHLINWSIYLEEVEDWTWGWTVDQNFFCQIKFWSESITWTWILNAVQDFVILIWFLL